MTSTGVGGGGGGGDEAGHYYSGSQSDDDDDDYYEEEEEDAGLTEGTASSPPSTPGAAFDQGGAGGYYYHHHHSKDQPPPPPAGTATTRARASKAWSWDKLPGPVYEAMDLNKARAKVRAAHGERDEVSMSQQRAERADERKRLFFFPTTDQVCGLVLSYGFVCVERTER
jgi:hypothetical protein